MRVQRAAEPQPLAYLNRIQKKKKDQLSRSYRDWHKKLSRRKKRRPNFDEDGILDELKKANVVSGRVIGEFRECLHVRHWVGHGRYWQKPVLVDRLDPDDVYARAAALLRALPS